MLLASTTSGARDTGWPPLSLRCTGQPHNKEQSSKNIHRAEFEETLDYGIKMYQFEASLKTFILLIGK